MLRDITRATNAVVFSFLFCFVRSRVSFAKSVDDNVERTLVLLFIFVIFFFFHIIAHLNRSKIVPCLQFFYFFGCACFLEWKFDDITSIG